MRRVLSCAAILSAPVAAQAVQWHRLQVANNPFVALAYDESRERVMRFEGSASAPPRTWELVGDAWSLRSTPIAPEPRLRTAMTYDPVRRRVLLFGGQGRLDRIAFSDTWEWDGAAWTRVSASVAGLNPLEFQLAFDHATNRPLLQTTVMHGLSPGRTYSWNGASWVQVAGGSPSLYYGFAMASDPVRGRIVLFGTDSLTSQTWEWNGVAWSLETPPSLPSPRYGAAMAYVASRNRVTLFGGYAGGIPLDDFWEWDGSSWTLVGSSGLPGKGMAMVHEAGRRRTVFVGGVRDWATWTWDGANRTTLTNSPPCEVIGAAVDSARRKLVVFDRQHGMMEWDGESWSASLFSSPQVYPAAGHGAYDLLRSKSVFVDPTRLVEWDGVTASIWNAPGFGPLSYDTARGRVLMFSNTPRRGLYEWDGAQWSALAESGALPQSAVGMAYDLGRYRHVVCSTQTNTRGEPVAFETYEWDGVTWQLAHTGVSPEPRFGCAMTWDGTRQRVLLFGGNSGGSAARPFSDTWEWHGTSWSRVGSTTEPSPRSQAHLLFDPVERRSILVGGWTSIDTYGLVSQDMWWIDAQPFFSSHFLGNGCGFSAPAPALGAGVASPGADAFTLDLLRAPPSAPSVFGIGFASGNVPLGGGCTLFVPQPAALLFVPANAAGFASVRMSIPASVVGLSFAAQAAALDPSAPLGVALTQGLRLTVGF